MSKKKVCKKCKLFVDGNQCPLCKGETFANNWMGRVLILDPKRSTVAQKMNIDNKGEYAIKIR
ncbi:MAG: transcription elongation factor subunit Spt4 [Nanoarchaeota archaeon]